MAICARLDATRASAEDTHMNLTHVEAFLTLAEERHFGRTAERLGLSQPRVSRLIAALEREVGGALFERASRPIGLTPLGAVLRDRWQRGYDELTSALEDARAAARQPGGTLRLGFILTTTGSALTRLVREFRARRPDCRVTLHEVGIGDLYQALRRGEIDVLVSWLTVREPDLTAGPVIARRRRALAVASGHPLARCPTVSAEVLADYDTVRTAPQPPGLLDAIIPPRTPSGRPVRGTRVAHSLPETLALVAAGQAVHPTVAGLPLARRADITLVPISDLPPLPLGLIWCTSHENATIRELAAVAAGLTRGDPDRKADRVADKADGSHESGRHNPVRRP
jgi:DNA-binding transcriptional LysR family regulator